MSDHTDDDSIELEGPARTAREALLKYLVGFVCTDIDGVEHDLAYFTPRARARGSFTASMPIVRPTSWSRTLKAVVSGAAARSISWSTKPSTTA